MTKEPLAHLARRTPPWRESALTECGRPLNDVGRWVSRDEAQALIRKHGMQRAEFALIVCMTCWQTSDRYCDWATSPSSVVARDGSSRWAQEPTLMDRELFAIAALVEAHRAEFNGYLTDLGETVSLAARRAQQRKPGR